MGTVLKTALGVILGGIVLAGLGLGGYYLLQPSQGSSGSGQVSETPDTADAAREVKLTKANAVLARFCLDSLGGESQSDRAYSRAAKAVDTLMSAAMSNGDDLLPW